MTKTTKLKDGYLAVSLKLRETSSAEHQLFIKAHHTRASDPNKPGDRTLFVLNVPPFVSKASLENVFSVCGPVQKIYLHKKPTAKVFPEEKIDLFTKQEMIKGYQVAYIVFRRAQSLKKALDPDFKLKTHFYGEDDYIEAGIRRWCHEYGKDYVDADALQKDINTFMEEFDRKEQEKKEIEKEQDGVPDDEGWVTVTRHSKHRGLSRTEMNEKRILARERKKRREKELLNFYTFQQRESKREHIAKLRQMFEEDKARIEQMKATRKFRPY